MPVVNKELENSILNLLSKNLMSVTQVANTLGIRKDLASKYLEFMRQQGKLELFVVGTSNVYTVPRSVQADRRYARTIAITSGKGGVGKTVVTINLASALMEFKTNVIAVDADVKMSSLGLQLGMYYFPVTLNNILKDNVDILNALYMHPSGLRIIPASLSIDDVDISNFSNFSKSFANRYFDNTILLVDSPPGLEENTIQVMKACKETIVVTTPEIPAIADAIKTIDTAREVGSKVLGVIVNRYRRTRKQISVDEIEAVCELPILGVIPEDKMIIKSIYKKMPVVFLNKYAKSSVAFKKIAARLLGFEYKPPLGVFLKRLLIGWRK